MVFSAMGRLLEEEERESWRDSTWGVRRVERGLGMRGMLDFGDFGKQAKRRQKGILRC
jgi:hypothetical protein